MQPSQACSTQTSTTIIPHSDEIAKQNMSRPAEYYIFDPGFPEIVITSATPRVAAFGRSTIPKRRAKSQDPGLLKVPKREIGDKRARDPRALERSLRRSPSTPVLARDIQSDKIEKTLKYAAKAPWVLEGKGPARLDLSLWRPKKSRVPNEIVAANNMSTEKSGDIPPAQNVITGNAQSRPFAPEIPTFIVDMNSNAIPKTRSHSSGNGKINRNFRLVEDRIYRGDLEVTMDVEALLKTAEEEATT